MLALIGTVMDPRKMIEATSEEQLDMLGPRVEIAGIVGEKDLEKINEVVFELYKEAVRVVTLVAHLFDEAASDKGGWPRNQAVCAGLMIRIAKLMLVVTQLSAKRDRAEVVNALNRSISESAVNLEFLVVRYDDTYFDQFVKFSLGPEKELYDAIHAKISERGGEAIPIEQRMLDSIDYVCRASGVKIEDVNRKYGDWGGGLRERLKFLDKEERYVGIQRIPSHAVHGTWVDLCMNHLEYDSEKDVFGPNPKFSLVDARLLGPTAMFVLEATRPYLARFFPGIPESEMLVERLVDLRRRLSEADAAHERLMAQNE